MLAVLGVLGVLGVLVLGGLGVLGVLVLGVLGVLGVLVLGAKPMTVWLGNKGAAVPLASVGIGEGQSGDWAREVH